MFLNHKAEYQSVVRENIELHERVKKLEQEIAELKKQIDLAKPVPTNYFGPASV